MLNPKIAMRSAASWSLLSTAIVVSGCFGDSKLFLNRASNGPDPSTTPDVCTPSGDPGRVTLHRLNRVEYDNTVRDLLGDTSRPARDFPTDDFGYGFDNIADVLSVSPLLLEKYQSAAEGLIEAAWTRDLSSCSPSPILRICDPAGADCGRRIVTRFVRRAWRRSATPSEIDGLTRLFAVAASQGDPPEAGVKLALQAVLLSPNFVFRVELDGDPASTAPHAITDHELATRLSYFIWSSMPDDELAARADDATLHNADVLNAQVRRMLRDPKSSALQENFAGEWLYTRGIDSIQPDPLLFPQFDADLRVAMRQETELFFRSLLDEDRSALELLGTDYTFLNDRLADHYRLPRVGGSQMRRVSVAGTQRGGILAQASFLAVTSHSNRTSPVKRGKWILGQLMCSEPPAPPPNVPPLPEGQGEGGTLRQRLEAHRASPVCAGCHGIMDPIGFGLENFDAIGRWRDRDTDGTPIDSAGQLPGGGSFSDARQLASLLKQDPRLPNCFVRQLLTYSLGRGTTQADTCALAQMTEAFKSSHYRLGDLFSIIANSDSFMRRRGEAEAAP